MLGENKVKCYKEICAFIGKDEAVKGLGAPEPRQNFDLIYHIKDALFTYSLMNKNDLLKYSVEVRLKNKVDQIELKKIADRLRDNDDLISIVSFDDYIKLQMAVQLANMPEENAMSFVYEKAVYFHNKMKEKILAFELPTIEVEYKGKMISNSEDEQYIGKGKSAKKKKDIMGEYLDLIKVSHDDNMNHTGILNGHAIPDLNNNVMEYIYNNGELTLRYVAEKNIVIDETLKESTASFYKNKCTLTKRPSKLTEIEVAVNDMVSIINYINNNSSFTLTDEEPETVACETDNSTDKEKASEEAKEEVKKDIAKPTKETEQTLNIEVSKEVISEDKIAEKPVTIEQETPTVKAKLFVKPTILELENNVDTKEPDKIEPEESVVPTSSDKEDKMDCYTGNKYTNSEVQKEYMNMYKHMNEIYEERENVFLIKETKLKEREHEVEKEQQNIKELRSDLNKKWNDYNVQKKALNTSFNEYAEKMKVLNEKEIEIAKATAKLNEEKKSYETKALALDERQDNYERAKRNLLDEQSMTIELKNNLEEREAKLKLREAEIEKKIQMNSLTEHQLSAREQTLNARKKENISVSDAEFEKLKNDNAKLKSDNESLKNTVTDLHNEINNMVDECNKQLTDMENQANRLILDIKNTPVVDEAKIKESQNTIDTLKLEIDKLNTVIKNQEKSLIRVKALEENYISIKEEKNTIQNSYEELLNKNGLLEEENLNLEKSLNDYKNMCEPDISARATKELLLAAGYNFDLIPTEGDVIVGCEINDISICINENAKMIYAEKPVKKGIKHLSNAKDWNDESISAAYIILSDKVVCKKTFIQETVVEDVQDIINKFTSLK